uniref:Uncharacterized protein n=1 Tax=Cacopsylla melanoneura TaxID=428564 RepID=A0A8D9DQ05_9HEMI
MFNLRRYHRLIHFQNLLFHHILRSHPLIQLMFSLRPHLLILVQLIHNFFHQYHLLIQLIQNLLSLHILPSHQLIQLMFNLRFHLLILLQLIHNLSHHILHSSMRKQAITKFLKKLQYQQHQLLPVLCYLQVTY